MAVKSHRLGPGTLSLGEAGSPVEFGAQITNGRVVPTADDGETLDVLSGDQLRDIGDETWTLEGTVLQSYDSESLLIWCNRNTGTEVAFTFKPVTTQDLEVTGRVLVRSLEIGGDVKTRNTSDFAFQAFDVEILPDEPVGA